MNYKEMLARHRFEKEIGEKAMKRYFKTYGSNAAMPSSPRIEYEDDGFHVILENVNGILAKYRYKGTRPSSLCRGKVGQQNEAI